MIACPAGIFGVIAYHGQNEDVQNVDSRFVRDSFHQYGIEVIRHFCTFNLDTNVVVTYPEVRCQPAPPPLPFALPLP